MDKLIEAVEALLAEVNAHLDYEDDADMEAARDRVEEALAAVKGED